MIDNKIFNNSINKFIKTTRKLRKLLTVQKFTIIIEIGIVFVAAVLLYWFLIKYIPGGISSTDVTFYMNLGLNNLKDTSVYNRYVHIFLQKFFLETASTPVAGEHNYWTFIMVSTALLIYWNVRLLFNRRMIIGGISSVLIYLSINIFLQFADNVFPDLSVMFMVNIFLLAYLASVNRGNHSKLLLLILGAVFYLALKTKETALFPLLVLLPGIGFIANRFDFPLFKKNTLIFFIGVLIGVFCFALLSGLILKDPFWGLRWGEIKDFSSYVIGGAIGISAGAKPDLQNWYSSFLLGSITFPFVFYLLSGMITLSEVTVSKRLVWLMPLAAIMFIIPVTNVSWGGRFFMPVIPIVCLLGSSLINEGVLVQNKQLIFKTSLWIFIGLGLYAGIRIGMRYVLPLLGYDVIYIITVIVNPLLFTVMLADLFLVSKSSYFRNMVLTLILLILTISIIIINFKTAISSPLSANNVNVINYQSITSPFNAFSGEIHYSPGMRLATINNIWTSSMTKNIDELMCLFNVYFDASTTRESFIISDNIDQLVAQGEDQGFNYILISSDEWNHVLSELSLAIDLQESYRILADDQGKYVLLERK